MAWNDVQDRFLLGSSFAASILLLIRSFRAVHPNLEFPFRHERLSVKEDFANDSPMNALAESKYSRRLVVAQVDFRMFAIRMWLGWIVVGFNDDSAR